MEMTLNAPFGLLSVERTTTTSGFDFTPYLKDYSSPSFQIEDLKSNNIGRQKHISEASIPEQLSALQKYFGLSKSDLARILHVTRPALYAWFDGTSEPSAENAQRIKVLCSLVDTAVAENCRPLFHAYIERPVASFTRSLLEALSENHINPEDIHAMTAVIRKMTEERAARISKNRQLEAGVFSEAEQQQILDANLLAIQSGD